MTSLLSILLKYSIHNKKVHISWAQIHEFSQREHIPAITVQIKEKSARSLLQAMPESSALPRTDHYPNFSHQKLVLLDFELYIHTITQHVFLGQVSLIQQSVCEINSCCCMPHSFSLPYSISLHDYTTMYKFALMLMDIWVVSSLGPSEIMLP